MTTSHSKMLLRTELHHPHQWMMNWPELIHTYSQSYTSIYYFLKGHVSHRIDISISEKKVQLYPVCEHKELTKSQKVSAAYARKDLRLHRVVMLSYVSFLFTSAGNKQTTEGTGGGRTFVSAFEVPSHLCLTSAFITESQNRSAEQFG